MSLRYGSSVSPRPSARLSGCFERRATLWPVRRWLDLDGAMLSYRHKRHGEILWQCDLRECGLGPGKRAREIILLRPGEEPLSLFALDLQLMRVWFAQMKMVSDSVYDFYHFSAKLGHVTHGAIYLGQDKSTSQAVAIHAEEKAHLSLSKSLILTKRDLSVVAATQSHEALVTVVDLFESSKRFYTVTELISGGTLEQALQRRSISEQIARGVLSDVLRGLAHMHSRRLVHGRVDAEHVVCTRRELPCAVKLSAYGSAVASREARLLDDGDASHAAPEVVCFQRHAAESDVFSAGVLLFRLLSGAVPFPHTHEAAYLTRVSRGASVVDGRWEAVSPAAKKLVVAMLADDATARPSAAQCLDSVWFRRAVEGLDGSEVEPLERLASDPKTVIVDFARARTLNGGAISRAGPVEEEDGDRVAYGELD